MDNLVNKILEIMSEVQKKLEGQLNMNEIVQQINCTRQTAEDKMNEANRKILLYDIIMRCLKAGKSGSLPKEEGELAFLGLIDKNQMDQEYREAKDEYENPDNLKILEQFELLQSTTNEADIILECEMYLLFKNILTNFCDVATFKKALKLLRGEVKKPFEYFWGKHQTELFAIQMLESTLTEINAQQQILETKIQKEEGFLNILSILTEEDSAPLSIEHNRKLTKYQIQHKDAAQYAKTQEELLKISRLKIIILAEKIKPLQSILELIGTDENVTSICENNDDQEKEEDNKEEYNDFAYYEYDESDDDEIDYEYAGQAYAGQAYARQEYDEFLVCN
jgi:hypothetical protein